MKKRLFFCLLVVLMFNSLLVTGANADDGDTLEETEEIYCDATIDSSNENGRWIYPDHPKNARYTISIETHEISDVKPYVYDISTGKNIGTVDDGTRVLLRLNHSFVNKDDPSQKLLYIKTPTISGYILSEYVVPDKTLQEIFVEKALSYSGMTNSEICALGLNLVQKNWCASFVGCVAEVCGLSEAIPYSAGVRQLYNQIIKAGGTIITDYSDVQIGDIVFMNSFGHVGIICSVDETSFSLVHGNWHTRPNWKYSCVCSPIACKYRSNNDCKNGVYFLLNGQSTQGQSLTAVVRPDWDTCNDVIGAAQTKFEAHCPIDIEISYNGERLSTRENILSCSFGTISKNNDGSFTALLDYNANYNITITGNGDGEASFSTTYLDSSGEIISSSSITNVPITTSTVLKTSPLIANNGLELYSISQNTQEITMAWRAEANSSSSSRDAELEDYFTREAENDFISDDIGGDDVPGGSDDLDGENKPDSGIQFSEEIHEIAIASSINGSVTVSLSNASAGAVITLTVTPDEGYVLAYVTVDGQRISGSSFTMPGHAVTVSAVFVRAGLPFTDVAYGDWFYDEVAYVYANGLMEGVSDTAFEPGGGMTRAMVWAILARIDGVTVTGSNWADTARSWAMAKGVSDGENANAPVTREQLVAMLYRYAGEPVVSGSLTGWADAASVSGWAESAMIWAVNRGIITGATESTLAPADGATRAQCAAILMRYVEA